MKVKELRLAIRDTHVGLVRNPDDADMINLDDLLAIADELELSELCKKLAATLKGKKPGKSKGESKGKSRGAPEPSEAVVSKYLQELNGSKSETAVFEGVIRRAEKDAAVKADVAREIARQFTGQDRKHRTKRDAFKAVLERQIADKRAEARAPQISDLF